MNEFSAEQREWFGRIGVAFGRLVDGESVDRAAAAGSMDGPTLEKLVDLTAATAEEEIYEPWLMEVVQLVNDEIARQACERLGRLAKELGESVAARAQS